MLLPNAQEGHKVNKISNLQLAPFVASLSPVVAAGYEYQAALDDVRN
jgi:hypothetical protein